MVIAQDSGNRDNESYLALNLAWLEAEHGDTASAFDHLTLSIRNYHDSRNTALIRAPLAILAALFPARTLRRRATIAEFAAQLTSPLHGGQASCHGLSRASGFSGHRCTKTGQQCAGRRTGLQSVDSHERTESTSKLNTRVRFSSSAPIVHAGQGAFVVVLSVLALSLRAHMSRVLSLEGHDVVCRCGCRRCGHRTECPHCPGAIPAATTCPKSICKGGGQHARCDRKQPHAIGLPVRLRGRRGRDDTPSEMSWGRGLTPRHAATQDGGMYAAKCLPMNPDDIGKQRYGYAGRRVQA